MRVDTAVVPRTTRWRSEQYCDNTECITEPNSTLVYNNLRQTITLPINTDECERLVELSYSSYDEDELDMKTIFLLIQKVNMPVAVLAVIYLKKVVITLKKAVISSTKVLKIAAVIMKKTTILVS